jgi:hypothetical protein
VEETIIYRYGRVRKMVMRANCTGGEGSPNAVLGGGLGWERFDVLYAAPGHRGRRERLCHRAEIQRRVGMEGLITGEPQLGKGSD